MVAKQLFNVVVVSAVFVYIIGCVPSPHYVKKGTHLIDENSYVRVLLLKDQRKVEIVTKSKTKIIQLIDGSVLYNAEGNKFTFYDNQLSKPIQIETWDNEIQVNTIVVRGFLRLYVIVGKIQVVNVLKINEYLYGVLPSEIIAQWPFEVLKAQAVVARTYTYYHILMTKSMYYDLDATTNFQVYKGKSVETEKTNKAVDVTSGVIMMYANKPILAYYHSTCGGETEDDKYVWLGEDLPYLTSIKCPYCVDSPHYTWSYEVTLQGMYETLVNTYKDMGKIRSITLIRENVRVTSIKIEHSNGIIRMSGNDFRLLLDPKKIKSLYFTTEQTPRGLIFHGHGWGHGVGMCQWGARTLAQRGKKFDEILMFYYRGISIRKI